MAVSNAEMRAELKKKLSSNPRFRRATLRSISEAPRRFRPRFDPLAN